MQHHTQECKGPSGASGMASPAPRYMPLCGAEVPDLVTQHGHCRVLPAATKGLDRGGSVVQQGRKPHAALWLQKQDNAVLHHTIYMGGGLREKGGK